MASKKKNKKSNYDNATLERNKKRNIEKQAKKEGKTYSELLNQYKQAPKAPVMPKKEERQIQTKDWSAEKLNKYADKIKSTTGLNSYCTDDTRFRKKAS